MGVWSRSNYIEKRRDPISHREGGRREGEWERRGGRERQRRRETEMCRESERERRELGIGFEKRGSKIKSKTARLHAREKEQRGGMGGREREKAGVR